MDPSNPSTWAHEYWEQDCADKILASVMRKIQEVLPYSENEFVDYVFFSNNSEGIPVNMEDTRKIVRAHTSLTNMSPPTIITERLVTQHLQALMFIRHRGWEDFSVDTLKDLHRILMTGINSDVIPGSFRTHECHATGVKNRQVMYCGPQFIQGRMDALMSRTTLLLKQHSVSKGICPETFYIAGMFLVRFLEIHPFSDGNGRISRLVSTWILHMYGFPTVLNLTVKQRDVKNYIRMLDHIQHRDGCESLAANFVLRKALLSLELLQQ